MGTSRASKNLLKRGLDNTRALIANMVNRGYQQTKAASTPAKDSKIVEALGNYRKKSKYGDLLD